MQAFGEFIVILIVVFFGAMWVAGVLFILVIIFAPIAALFGISNKKTAKKH